MGGSHNITISNLNVRMREMTYFKEIKSCLDILLYIETYIINKNSFFRQQKTNSHSIMCGVDRDFA